MQQNITKKVHVAIIYYYLIVLHISSETVATLLHSQTTIIAAVVSMGLLLSLSTLACLLIFYVLRKK